MSNWERFEIECTNYLNYNFSRYATFTHKGGSDSQESDIMVETKNGKIFYIDVKYLPAQCGQFVLLPNFELKKFEYSSKNATKINIYSEKIIEHLNNNFDEFSVAGTTGKDIIMSNEKDIFSNWIIKNYQEKNVQFFITNDFKIFDIKNIKDDFLINGKYRTKKSGSSSVGKKQIKIVLEYIKFKYMIHNFNIDEDKLFIISSEELDKIKFFIDNAEYMFSLRSINKFEIRKLSKTHNSNVIFSIKQKTDKTGIGDIKFIDYIEKL